MSSDMHNLYVAIGSGNALRSNYNLQMIPGENYAFGRCEMIIYSEKKPTARGSHGCLARANLYMDQPYLKHTLASSNESL